MEAGISTLGITFGYGVEATAGDKPASFTQLHRASVITAFKALSGGKRMWFETIIPGFTESFFAVAQPPTAIPQPDIDQNGLLTVEMNLTIEEYVGMDESVAFA